MTIAIFNEGEPPPCPVPYNLALDVLSAGEDADTALIVADPGGASEHWRYADLRGAVFRTAGGMVARGIAPGDHLLLRIGNDPAFAVCFLAAIVMGAVPVPTSPMLTPPELARIVAELEPRAAIFAGGQDPIPLDCTVLDATDLRTMATSDPVPAQLGDPARLAYMIYTSGTSGRPRAVMHAHRAVWARRMMWDGWYGLRMDDRMLHAGAFNWTFTLGTGLLDPWAIGATAIVATGTPERDTWGRLARALSPTIFAAAPGVFRQVTARGATGFDSLRHALCAGEKLPEAIRKRWTEQTGKPIHEALGMSECSTFISGAPGMDVPPGAIGRPQPGRHVAVLGPDDQPVARGTAGTLAVHLSDPGLFLGYFRQPQETAATRRGHWFVTGDTVVMDERGHVTYLGREDDMMNAGGFRVSPVEVEAAMLAEPGVTEAAAAEVSVKPGTSVIVGFYAGTAEEDTLMAALPQRLARYKCPRLVVRLPALPRGANNKILRKPLRDWRPE